MIAMDVRQPRCSSRAAIRRHRASEISRALSVTIRSIASRAVLVPRCRDQLFVSYGFVKWHSIRRRPSARSVYEQEGRVNRL